MRPHEKDQRAKGPPLQAVSHSDCDRQDLPEADRHVVFDFTGLERPGVSELALILTARLQTPVHEAVWVRALPWKTARVLRALGLDHLFRHYPTSGVLN
jgi:hypothetical protein